MVKKNKPELGIKNKTAKYTLLVAAVVVLGLAAISVLDSFKVIRANTEMYEGLLALGAGAVIVCEATFESRRTEFTIGKIAEYAFAIMAFGFGFGAIGLMPEWAAMFAGVKGYVMLVLMATITYELVWDAT